MSRKMPIEESKNVSECICQALRKTFRHLSLRTNARREDREEATAPTDDRVSRRLATPASPVMVKREKG